MASKRRDVDPEALHEADEAERTQQVVGLPQTRDETDELHRQMRAASSATVVVAIVAMLTMCYVAKLPIIVLLISILLATVSWTVVEKPMNALKRYWPYGSALKSPPERRLELDRCHAEACSAEASASA